jgi:23S rRNA pseudouridine2605 synthase
MTSKKPAEDGPAKRGERIAKVIARAGLCSRREAERLIAAGRVTLDGETLKSAAVDVVPEQAISVDGRPLPRAEAVRLFRFYKPTGVLVAERDPEGRPTIYDTLARSAGMELPRLLPVGRLDLNSEGLLLLTNDGELKRKLELPATGWIRRYRARVRGRVDPARLASLKDGITIDGVRYGSIEASLDRQQGANAWVTLSLTEGKNREVRRVLAAIDLEVNRLIRVSYGPFHLGKLPRGRVEEVPPAVIEEQLGIAVTAPGEDRDPSVRKTRDRSRWAKPKARKTAQPGLRRKQQAQRARREGAAADSRPDTKKRKP